MDAQWVRLEQLVHGLSRSFIDPYALYFSTVTRTCWAASGAASPGGTLKPAASPSASAGAAALRLKQTQQTLKAIVHAACMWLSQVPIANPHALATPASASTPSSPTSAAAAAANSNTAAEEVWVLAAELQRAGYSHDIRMLIHGLVEVVCVALKACESDARRERLQLYVVQMCLEVLSTPPPAVAGTPGLAAPSTALHWLFTEIAFVPYLEQSKPPLTVITSPSASNSAPSAAASSASSSSPGTASSSTAGADYRRFTEQVMSRACQMVVSDGRLLSTTVCRICERLSAWPCNPVLSDWLMQLASHMKRARRFGLLFSVTKACVPQLALQLQPPAVSAAATTSMRRCWAAYRVFEHLLLGYQSEPDVFHECIPALAALLDALTGALPPLAITAATTTAAATVVNTKAQPLPPALQERARYLFRIGQLVQCLVHAQPGYAAVYAPLMSRVRAADRVVSAPPYNALQYSTAPSAPPSPAHPIITASPALPSSALSPVVQGMSALTLSAAPAAAASSGAGAGPASASPSFLMSDSQIEERLLSHKWVLSGKHTYPFVEGNWQSTIFCDLYLHVEEEVVGHQLRGTAYAAANGFAPANATIDAFAYIPTDEAEYVLSGTYRNLDDARKSQSTVLHARCDAALRSFDGTHNYGEEVYPLAAVRTERYAQDAFAFSTDFRGHSQHAPDGGADSKGADAAAVAEQTAKALQNVYAGTWAEVEVAGGGVPSERSMGASAVIGSQMFMFGRIRACLCVYSSTPLSRPEICVVCCQPDFGVCLHSPMNSAVTM
jgi:hypothetical protein